MFITSYELPPVSEYEVVQPLAFGGGGGSSWGDSDDNTFYGGGLISTPPTSPNLTGNWTSGAGNRYIADGDGKQYYYTFVPTVYKLTSDTQTGAYYPQLVDRTIYAVTCSSADYTAYYVNYSDLFGVLTFYRLTSSDLTTVAPDGIIPTDPSFSFTGDNWVEFLANFGQSLLENPMLSNLLSVEINGTNLLAFLLTSGFMVYCTYVIVKFFLP